MQEPKVGDKNSTATGKEPVDGFEENPSEHYISAFFSFFLLWILALVLGQAMKYVYLPPLFGNILLYNLLINLDQDGSNLFPDCNCCLNLSKLLLGQYLFCTNKTLEYTKINGKFEGPFLLSALSSSQF